ncbi:MAG: zinc-binding dehydrogenase [Rhizobiales bacterium]|nr:zinc-binding dehydrogenase [Hyphomicrobiales bacterium]
MKNRKFVLARRPDGTPRPDDFRLETEELPTLGEGQLLVRNQFISVDPGMRAALDDVVSYTQPVPLGGVIPGATVGVVETSNNPKFKKGDFVAAGFGWQEYGLSDGRGIRIVPDGPMPSSTAIGVLGIPGLTAYFGLLSVGRLKEGDTVLVTSAAGAVGTAVAQIAALKGAKVVAVAGGAEKCQWLRDEIGVADVIDYRGVPDLAAAIAAMAPDGIDVLFDNVGNAMIDLTLPMMRQGGRIVVCGQVADYNIPASRKPGIVNTSAFISHRLTMSGFVAFDYAREFRTAWGEMTDWILEGKLKYREDIAEGFEKLPEAFIGLFGGKNFGRKLILVF